MFPHATSVGVERTLKYLVCCPCGHSVERHGGGGCAGDVESACGCRYDQDQAVDAAVAAVRADAAAWRAFHGLPNDG